MKSIRPTALSATAFVTSQKLPTPMAGIGQEVSLGSNCGTRLSEHSARFNRRMTLLRRHK